MTATTRRPRTIYTNPSRAARPLPEASGRERFWWYFMRLSGLALVILALGHMFIMHVLVVITGTEIDFAFVQSRWGTPFWRRPAGQFAFRTPPTGRTSVVGPRVRVSGDDSQGHVPYPGAGSWLRTRPTREKGVRGSA